MGTKGKVFAKASGRYLSGSYTVDELNLILSEMLMEAENSGFSDCTFNFESTMEPYEDFLGSPEVVLEGYREATKQEKEDTERHDYINSVANEKGISYFEAVQYLNLVDKGVI